MTGENTKQVGFRWGFFSASLVILFLVCVGQAVGMMIERFGIPADAPRVTDRAFGERVSSIGAKDGIFLAFLVSSAVFVWLQRDAVRRFFRTMHVGVSLIGLSCFAVAVGVLIPQIDGFEDPSERVTPANYEEQYKAFRWAEGYFLYHLMHPYGIGMPDVPVLPPQMEAALERFGHRYGQEEHDNRAKQMKSAFTGNEKTKEIGAFIDRHDAAFRRFFDVSTALHLNRTYKSHWFATLLGLLFTGVFFNTFKFRPSAWFSTKKIGFFTVHMGVMTLLIGGAISKSQTDRGIMHMDLRAPPSDEYDGYHSPDKRRRMPFALKLERFARRDWKSLQVHFLEEKFSSKPPIYTLWPGREIDLDYTQAADADHWTPRIRLRVRDLSERATVLPTRFHEAEPGANGSGPLAALAVSTPHEAHEDDDLVAHEPHGEGGEGAEGGARTLYLAPVAPLDFFDDPAWRFRVKVAHGEDPNQALRLFPSDTGTIGTLAIRVAARGDVEPKLVPFKLGERIDAPGGFTIEVQEATANFRLEGNRRTEIRDPRPLAQQAPANPAVWVLITPKEGGKTERRLLLESVDWVEVKQQDKFDYPDLVLHLDWERWQNDGPPRYVMHWGSTAGPLLLDESGGRSPIGTGKPLPLPGSTQLVAQAFLNDVVFDRDTTKRIEFSAPHIDGPHFDEDFYATDSTGLELEVTTLPGTPQEKVELIRMASTDEGRANVWRSPDGRFLLHYFTNAEAFPFEWRSVLSVYEKDAQGKLTRVDVGPESEREIRVNDYFQYKGYRFFQTNAIPELPTYSGIGVVYDPGIPTVLAGMYVIILGTLLAFIVRPIVEAYGRRGRQRQAAPTAPVATGAPMTTGAPMAATATRGPTAMEGS